MAVRVSHALNREFKSHIREQQMIGVDHTNR